MNFKEILDRIAFRNYNKFYIYKYEIKINYAVSFCVINKLAFIKMTGLLFERNETIIYISMSDCSFFTDFIKNIIDIQKNLFYFLKEEGNPGNQDVTSVISPFYKSNSHFLFLLHNLNNVVQFPELNVSRYIKVIEFISRNNLRTTDNNSNSEIESAFIAYFQPEELFPSIFNRRFAVMCLIKFGVLDINFVLSQVTPTMAKYFEKSDELISDNPDPIASSIRADNLNEFKDQISSQNDLNQKMSQSLFERCQFVNESTYLEYATFFNSKSIIQYLIENGAKETEKSQLIKLLYNSEENDHYYYLNTHKEILSKMNENEIEFLIEYHRLNELNFESNSNLRSILLKASNENNILPLLYFLPFLSDVKKDSIKPSLNIICETGRSDMIDFLNADIELNSKLDWNGRKIKNNPSLFESAIKNDHFNVVKSLLNVKGIDIRGIYHHEETPLHYAAKYNMTVIGHFLLSTKKINVNCKDSVFNCFFIMFLFKKLFFYEIFKINYFLIKLL